MVEPPFLPPPVAASGTLPGAGVSAVGIPSPLPGQPGDGPTAYNSPDSQHDAGLPAGVQVPPSLLRSFVRVFRWPCANCTCDNTLPATTSLLLYVASVASAAAQVKRKQRVSAPASDVAMPEPVSASAAGGGRGGSHSVRSSSSADTGTAAGGGQAPGSPNAALDVNTPRPSPQPEDEEPPPPGLAQPPPYAGSDGTVSDDEAMWGNPTQSGAARQESWPGSQLLPEEQFCAAHGVPLDTALPLPPLPPLSSLRCEDCGRPAVLPGSDPCERLLSLTLPHAVYPALLEALGAAWALRAPLHPPAGSTAEYGMSLPAAAQDAASSLPEDDASAAGSDSTAPPKGQPELLRPPPGASAVHQAVYCGAGAGVDVPELLLTSRRVAQSSSSHFVPFLAGQHLWREAQGGLAAGGTPLLCDALSPPAPSDSLPPGAPVWGGGKGLSAISALQRAASRAVDTPPPPGAGRPDSPAPPGLMGGGASRGSAVAQQQQQRPLRQPRVCRLRSLRLSTARHSTQAWRAC